MIYKKNKYSVRTLEYIFFLALTMIRDEVLLSIGLAHLVLSPMIRRERREENREREKEI